MARRPCLNCPNLAEPGKPRCTPCEQQHQARRNAARPHYRGPWPAISKAARAHHLATVGPVCPGWHRAAHQVPARDLTTDHVDPRSLAQGVRVLCKSCNSARRNETENANERVIIATLDIDGQLVHVVR